MLRFCTVDAVIERVYGVLFDSKRTKYNSSTLRISSGIFGEVSKALETWRNSAKILKPSHCSMRLLLSTITYS